MHTTTGNKMSTINQPLPPYAAHSPGQWRCREGRDGEFLISSESGGFAPLARVKGDKRSTLAQAKANAQLMAAAPKLLQALTVMMDSCYDPDRNDEAVAAFDLARDAIAAAEGFK
jgi:hypothetical protein